MASTGLDFTQITPDNGAVREISRLVFKDVLTAERIGSLLNVFRGVYNGDKLGIIGEFGLLGTASTGCSPTWGNDAMDTSEKTWDIASWQIAEQLCYADVENTLVKYTLNNGTDIADMTANDYLDEIVVPRLELRRQRRVWCHEGVRLLRPGCIAWLRSLRWYLCFGWHGWRWGLSGYCLRGY